MTQPEPPKVQVGWLEAGGHHLPLTDIAKDNKKDNCLSVKGDQCSESFFTLSI